MHAAAAGLAALLLAAPGAARAPEQPVTVHLRLDERPHGSRAERERLRELEYALMDRLAAGAGRLVRDEWRDGYCVLHLAGPDARALWAAVEPAVRAAGPRPGSYAVLRAGPEGAPEERIPLGAGAVTPPR
ncbi:hypothetical protein [Anaeromyxobacter dehalogenans]|uniref:Uncharacterized protein n=1 Tax=Anaeromyxobacter dehalogenans (strain 2CP-C) TaxID=290397 RepID=Q2II07_ANADE|nr:hypothetical protein [Anaeromyxobacter dehalogenans]ABC81287.1 hypothetical protein Adeh_1514 [Anaeromyxobacter dehalogenans 2CP-C]